MCDMSVALLQTAEGRPAVANLLRFGAPLRTCNRWALWIRKVTRHRSGVLVFPMDCFDDSYCWFCCFGRFLRPLAADFLVTNRGVFPVFFWWVSRDRLCKITTVSFCSKGVLVFFGYYGIILVLLLWVIC